MSKIYLPNSTQLDTLNEKVGAIGDTLAGQQLVTKDAVVSALGYEPEAALGNYELIEEITLTEDTSEIIRTQEPDGTAYKYKRLCINFKTPFAGNQYTNLYFSCKGSMSNGYQTYTRLSQNDAVAGRYGFTRVDCFVDSGEWRIFQREFMAAWSSPNAGYYAPVQEGTLSYCNHWKRNDGEYLNYLKIYENKSTEPIPAGTTITIYGIRA